MHCLRKNQKIRDPTSCILQQKKYINQLINPSIHAQFDPVALYLPNAYRLQAKTNWTDRRTQLDGWGSSSMEKVSDAAGAILCWWIAQLTTAHVYWASCSVYAYVYYMGLWNARNATEAWEKIPVNAGVRCHWMSVCRLALIFFLYVKDRYECTFRCRATIDMIIHNINMYLIIFRNLRLSKLSKLPYIRLSACMYEIKE